MKSVYLALRVIRLKGGQTITTPIGAFTDKEDAIKAADAGPRALAGARPDVKQAIDFVGVGEVGGGWMEVPFVAGSGIQIPESKLILP